MSDKAAERVPGTGFTPLRHQAFRRVWFASIPSNFGLLINSVGASWAMTLLSGEAGMVALVQTALMLPYMLFAVLAGAICDTYDRRKVGIAALFGAIASSSALFLAAWFGLLTPWLLLVLCFLTGSANAMFGPVWMSSVSEMVPRVDLPQGIALNSVSYNIARAFGPAVGGAVVAVAGPVAAFGTNAISYLPMLWAQVLWKRQPEKPRLPPEQLMTAIASGLRFVGHSPPMRKSIVRSLLFGIAGASVQALLPLIANEQLQSGAGVYGVLLGFFGFGAVIGAFLIPRARQWLVPESQVRLALLVIAVLVAALAFATTLPLACILLTLSGACWMLVTNALGVSVQARAPRWVTGRAVATFQAAIAGGLAIGSWLWGFVAQQTGLSTAIVLSAACLAIVAVLGRVIPVESTDEQDDGSYAKLTEFDYTMDLTGRSGPIVVTLEYRVANEDARDFYEAMTAVRGIRMRNGGYAWSLSRDIADTEKWVETFRTPTWHDYLRQRERLTEAERAQIAQTTPTPVKITRFIERPVGSVRWRDDTPDPGMEYLPPGD